MNASGPNFKSPGQPFSALGKAAQIMLFLGAFVFVVLCLTFVMTKANAILVFSLVIVVFLVMALFYWPEAGTVMVIFIIYTNLAVVGYKYHGLPQIVAASVSLLLGIPLTVYWFVRRKKFIIDYTWILMLGFLVAIYASLLVSINVTLAEEWIKTYLLEGVALYLIIINVVRKLTTLRAVVIALLVAGGLLGGLTLIQEATHNYGNNYGGLAQRNTENWQGGPASQTTLAMERSKVRLANRAGGPIGGPNRYAQILLVLLPLGLFRFFDEKAIRRKGLVLLLTTLTLGGALLTYSRGAFITFAVILAIVTFMRYIRFYQVALSALFFFLLVAIASPGYFDRMQTIGGVTALFSQDASAKADGATRGRVTEMLAALKVFLDYPLVGVGPGQYAKYYSVDYMADPEIAYREIGKSRKAHTLYFELMAETGLFGFGTFMAIVGYVLLKLWHLRRRASKARIDLANTATAFMLSVVTYLTSAVFLQLAYQRYFWLLIALAGAAIQIIGSELEKDESSHDALQTGNIGPEKLDLVSPITPSLQN